MNVRMSGSGIRTLPCNVARHPLGEGRIVLRWVIIVRIIV